MQQTGTVDVMCTLNNKYMYLISPSPLRAKSISKPCLVVTHSQQWGKLEK